MDLESGLARGDAAVLVRHPSGELTCGAALARARELAAELTRRGMHRVAVASARADVLIPALLACRRAGCELLLLRSPLPVDDPAWHDWSVTGLLDDDLRLHPLAAPSASNPGFAILLATSGTTGKPKIARHSIDALAGRIRFHLADAGQTRWLLTYHPAGFAGLQVLLTVLVSGAELIAASESNVPELSRAALAHKPTHISATPTFWRALLMALGERAAELPLRQITLGGEIVEQDLLDRLRAIYPHAGLTHIYASTEAGALFAVRDGAAGFPARWLEEAVDGVRLRIRDGELQALSPRAMLGYVAGTARSPVDEDGWLHTGDLVARRGERVYFLGRADNLISVGGAKLTPEEVEAVLLRVPGVAEGRVFGVRNPITGYLVGAEIVPAAGVDPEVLRVALMDAARAQLEPYKVPRMIRFTASIRVSEMGKKDRSA